MDIGETLRVTTRRDWRAWLEANHADRNEIWLVSYLKKTGRPNLAYNDAVEEALCFGWIDSIRKKRDDESYVQRYSPRRAGSGFSQTNKERLARLIAQGKVMASVVESHGDARPESFEIADDIVAALKGRPGAWEFFSGTSPSYQRIRAAYVEIARGRPDDFAKRLENLVRKSADGVQYGHDIEDYY